MKKNLILFAVLAAMLLSLTACDQDKAKPPAEPTDTPVKERLYPIWTLTPQGKEWGYINEAGKLVVTPQYESADFFTPYGNAVVGIKGHKALISLKGGTLLKPLYDSLSVYTEDRRIGVRDGTWTEMLDKAGKALYETRLTIHPMTEGGARIQEYVGDRILEGYIDDNGQVVIEPQFIYGTDFVNGKAVVKKNEGAFAIIDPAGNALVDFEAETVLQPTEDTFAFQQGGKSAKLWGYRDLAGAVTIKPAFAEANPFNKGIAIVAQKQKGVIRYGLINTKGKFVLHPKYARIEDLGNGFYAISRKTGPDFGQRSYPVAIFNSVGKRLTDYQYYVATACTADTVSVSDGNETWVLDSAGTPMSTMPRLTGMGVIRQEGNLLVSQADEERAYFTLAGKLIWQSPWDVTLKETIKLKRQKFRPDRGKLIYYPSLAGLADTAVQDTINSVFYQRFVGAGAPSLLTDGVPEEILRTDYISHLNKNLLIIEKTEKRIGKADGVLHQTVERIHLDITDGTQYTLKDLFREDSQWSQLLADQVRLRLAGAAVPGSLPLNPELVLPVQADCKFLAGRYGLTLYYDPATLGSASSDPLAFEIPYAEILKDISTEGKMWNAFLKQDM